MALTVARGLASRIRQSRHGFVIQVKGAPDLEAATTALARAGADIAKLDGGWQSSPGLRPGDRNGPTYVGSAVPTPAGPFLYVDAGETPDELLASIPEIVIRHLRDAGVTRAVVASPQPTETPLFMKGPVLDHLPRAVVLHLYPLPVPVGTTPQVPAEWLDDASTWVAEDLDRDTGAWAQALSVVFPIDRRRTREVFDQCRRAGIVQVVAGDLERRIRVLYVAFRGGPPAVAVAGGGPTATDAELLATMEELSQIARRLAPTLGYAHISVRPTFLGLQTGTWRGLPGGSNGYLDNLYDEIALDAMPWQLLGGGHLRRLEAAGALPLEQASRAQVRTLSADKVELALAEPVAWLPDSPDRDRVLIDGRLLLRPCLPEGDERDMLIAERLARRREAGR